jgi:acyl-CoA synthetase (AMP-forming)/AMP-acid ligase II
MIVVGISFANKEEYLFFKDVVFPIFKNKVIFIVQKEQTYQMIHIYHCLQKLRKCDLVMFCDDDDYFISNRIETFVNLKKENDDSKIIREIIPGHNEESEYWCYAIEPCILDDFYERSKTNMHFLRHKFGDMYLRNFLLYTQNYGDILTFTTKTPLYVYNTENENSIIRTIKRKKEDFEKNGVVDYEELIDQYILTIINNDTKKNAIMKSEILTEEIIKNFIKESEIRLFCVDLYK